MGGLLADDLQDGGRAEVELVEQEVVGVALPGLQESAAYSRVG
jgi:hypothetical protein